jgi:quinol monooxygenase YgiN
VPRVVCATWFVRPGCEEQALDALQRLTRASRGEPGCRRYDPSRDPERPGVFFIYEVYDDEAAFAAHEASDHFRAIAQEEAGPLLERVDLAFYDAVVVPA